MAGHVDLRHDRDETARRMRHDVAVLGLRVKAARSTADLCASANLGETGTGLDLDSPALVIREMQVQPVQLVQRHEVDEALHIASREEVPRYVEHHSAPLVARCIGDASRRQN